MQMCIFILTMIKPLSSLSILCSISMPVYIFSLSLAYLLSAPCSLFLVATVSALFPVRTCMFALYMYICMCICALVSLCVCMYQLVSSHLPVYMFLYCYSPGYRLPARHCPGLSSLSCSYMYVCFLCVCICVYMYLPTSLIPPSCLLVLILLLDCLSPVYMSLLWSLLPLLSVHVCSLYAHVQVSSRLYVHLCVSVHISTSKSPLIFLSTCTYSATRSAISCPPVVVVVSPPFPV